MLSPVETGDSRRSSPEASADHGEDERRRLSVFVSHTHGRHADGVTALLAAAGLQPFDWKDIPPGVSWSDSLLEALDDCYALVAFADDVNSATAVPLEIGVALGRGKPVVLLIEGSADLTRIPVPLRELPYITVGGSIQKAAERLRIELESASTNKSVRTRFSSARKLDRDRWDSVMEQEVAAALSRAGARVVAQSPVDKAARADLAAWFSDLISPALNPVLVEIKRRHFAHSVTISQIQHWLEELHLFFGMVVIEGTDAATWSIDREKAVVTIGFEHLKTLHPDELRNILNDGRNQLMHGPR
jgi:hypothetical protein